MLKHGISYKSALFFLSLFFFGNFALANKIIYVDDDAASSNDGSSWQNAFVYLSDALITAESEEIEKPLEIRVAQGTYKPNQGLLPVIPPGTPQRGGPSPGVWPADQGRDASFFLVNNVSIKGGYAGLNEPDPNERNIELYKSILSGDLNDNDIDIEAFEINHINDLIGNPVFLIIAGIF
ncbi:MAG: hypothetical protein JW787_17710 [Sedimentisphaerales bacterium]|nr:hypothetical protein [Sedimentisphaerales bacterium]